MKRVVTRFFCAGICAFLLIASSFSVFAAEGFSEAYYRVQDMADLLTDQEEETLIAYLDEISERQNMEVSVVTAENREGYNSMQGFADDMYDYLEYGYGENRDGVMLVIAMKERDWYISTCGYGITAFTDAGIEYIGDSMKEDLAKGDYVSAFHIFADTSDELISTARSGKPFDRSDFPRKPLSPMALPISVLIGAGIAILVVWGMKGQMKAVRGQGTAGNYVRDGSLQITQSRDQFLYHRVDRTKKIKESTSSGSSAHMSSSGTMHGGGGGKF